MNLNPKVALLIVRFAPHALLCVALVLFFYSNSATAVRIFAAMTLVSLVPTYSKRAKVWCLSRLTKSTIVFSAKTGIPTVNPRPGIVSLPDHAPAKPEQVLSKARLNRLFDETAEPAVMLQRVWPPNVAHGVASWLGGVPHLPVGVDWPINRDTGLALHHLAQIDLSQMPDVGADAGLPRQGVLWFFADINSMRWGKGPDMTEAVVIYHDGPAPATDPRAVPDHLPEIDHDDAQMMGARLSFRRPNRRVYPKWPVVGHPASTWPMDRLPEGVIESSNYHDALRQRVRQEQESILGTAIPPARGHPLLPEAQVEEAKKDGRAGHRTRITYSPEALGGRFPYTVHIARSTLQALHHQLLAKGPDYERELQRLKTSEDRSDWMSDKIEELESRVSAFAEAKSMVVRFLSDLETLGVTEALPQDVQDAFDDLMERYACGGLFGIYGAGLINGGLVTSIAAAVSTPDLQDRVPEKALNYFAGPLNASSRNGAHYLWGAKGKATNLTAGHGIRLAQFFSDGALGFMFCDVGIIDFWIAPEDLEAGRWDRAWAATVN